MTALAHASLSSSQLRAASWLLSAALVAAILIWALSARFLVQLGDTTPATAVEAFVQEIARLREPSAAASAPARTPIAQPDVASAPSSVSQGAATMATLRCATEAGRRANASLCAGVAQTQGRAREIAIAPVEGVATLNDRRGEALIASINASARTRALGEAQKYIDPRQDPLFEEGTDPATAAHRPCPAGTLPRGTGAGLTGRTCQVYR